MSKFASTKFIPSTFEERGVTVPFTTPQLVQLRARKPDRGKLEIVIPGFTGGAGAVVVPWAYLPQLLTLSLHDRRLHERVSDEKAITPDVIRKAAISVAADGYAGDEAANDALTLMQKETDLSVATRFGVLALTLESRGTTSRTQVMQMFARPDADKYVRGLIHDLALEVGLAGQDMINRLEQLADIVAALGIEPFSSSARLRSTLKELHAFKDHMAAWVDKAPVELSYTAQLCADTADRTLVVADGLTDEIVKALGDPVGTAQKWVEMAPKLTNAIQRLSWLLDGWSWVAARWRAAETATTSDKSIALDEILPRLPLVPTEEFGIDTSKLGAAIEDMSTRKMVKAMEDWRTGSAIDDLYDRIEKVKREAMK